MEFYIISEAIKDEYQGFQKQNFVINFSETNQGLWVINKGCGESIFTELDWESFETIELTNRDFIPTYETHPSTNGFRIVSVLDLYNETIDITIFDIVSYESKTINKPYINGTWTDEDVIFYVNQLNATN
jgi:hypothetical protein